MWICNAVCGAIYISGIYIHQAVIRILTEGVFGTFKKFQLGVSLLLCIRLIYYELRQRNICLVDFLLRDAKIKGELWKCNVGFVNLYIIRKQYHVGLLMLILRYPKSIVLKSTNPAFKKSQFPVWKAWLGVLKGCISIKLSVSYILEKNPHYKVLWSPTQEIQNSLKHPPWPKDVPVSNPCFRERAIY